MEDRSAGLEGRRSHLILVDVTNAYQVRPPLRNLEYVKTSLRHARRSWCCWLVARIDPVTSRGPPRSLADGVLKKCRF